MDRQSGLSSEDKEFGVRTARYGVGAGGGGSAPALHLPVRFDQASTCSVQKFRNGR